MINLETNIEEMWEKFQNLTTSEMTKAIKRALNKAAVILKDLTKNNFLASGINSHSPESKYNDSLEDGVRMIKARGNYDEDFYSTVHIMGTRASDSGTFRLRFFEKGTQDRFQQSIHGKPLQKPRYIGRIKPYWFFKNANQQIESQIDNIYLAEIDKATEKVNSTTT
jgi:HK97 gp10 family phage protein